MRKTLGEITKWEKAPSDAQGEKEAADPILEELALLQLTKKLRRKHKVEMRLALLSGLLSQVRYWPRTKNKKGVGVCMGKP